MIWETRTNCRNVVRGAIGHRDGQKEQREVAEIVLRAEDALPGGSMAADLIEAILWQSKCEHNAGPNRRDAENQQ